MAAAEPARQLPVEDQPDIGPGAAPDRPELRSLEGGEDTSEPTGQSEPEPDDQEQSPDDDDLRSQEEEPSFWKTGAGEPPPGIRTRLRFRITKRRAIFGGGMIGTIGTILFFLIFSSGPFQFIHIAQMMERFHFSHQENAGDDRMGKMYRFLRSGGDVGETRLGYLGSKMKTNMLADMEKIGLKPNYRGANVYEGFTIDTENPDSPYHGMSQDEVRASLQAKGINGGITAEGGKINVSVEGYSNKSTSLKFLVDQMGSSKVYGAVRVRVLSRYGLVTWHPLKKLDIAINQKLSTLYDEWQKSREERLKTGVDPGTVDASKAKEQQGVGKDGKPIITDVPGENTSLSFDKAKSILSSIKDSTGLKVVGGVSTAVGLVCAVRAIDTNIGLIRYVQVISPLMRMAWDVATIGSQIQNGNDVSSTEADFAAQNFNGIDSSGNSTNWSQAESIQAEQGLPGGVAVDAGVKESIAGGVPSWISWSANSAVGDLCGTVGQVASGLVSAIVGIFSGGIVNTVFGFVASGLVGQFAVEKLSSLLAGQTVNVLAKGADWGNLINFGSRLAGNGTALLAGGVALTGAQTAQLQAQEAAISQADFSSKSIAYKLFNAHDDRSAVSKLIDNTNPNIGQDVNKMSLAFLHFGSLFSSIPKLFSSPAHAAPLPYDYGFPEIGFSQSDLNNPLVADPFQNACQLFSCIDPATQQKTAGFMVDASDQLTPEGQDYISRAKECWGVVIAKTVDDDGKARWSATVPGVPADQQPNPYDPNYPTSKCQDSGNTNWLRVRFFVFDSGQMDGYACYNDDQQSCTNDGFDNSGSPASSSTSASSGTAVNGIPYPGQYSQAQLAQIFGDPGTASSHSAMDANLVSVDFLGHQVTVNKLVAPSLKAVADEILASGVNYQINDIGCYRYDSNNPPANIGLSSYHTYGAACDINPSTNPFVANGTAPHDMPAEYIKAFNDHGFVWGGDFNSVKDYQHFEWHGVVPGA